jgi:hypothetical protein
MLKKIGISKKNITAMQNIISDTMDNFKSKISSDNESEGEKYHPTLKKSESYQPLSSRQHNQRQNWEFDENEEKSNKRIFTSTYDNQYVEQRAKTSDKFAKNTPKSTMKSITNKANNQNYETDKYFHKSSASQKHLSSQKKPKKGKYLNYIESNKKGREVMEHINIVPLNGYVPDIIQNLVGQNH